MLHRKGSSHGMCLYVNSHECPILGEAYLLGSLKNKIRAGVDPKLDNIIHINGVLQN